MSGRQPYSSRLRRIRAAGVCLLLTGLLGLPALASASDRPHPTPNASLSALPSAAGPLFGGWGEYFPSTVTRSNVVRICVGIMAVALFIMMKKFEGGEPRPNRISTRQR